ncbi:MAG: response regulator [Treponema sp.]|nr:response regulator [Treponema sp.]
MNVDNERENSLLIIDDEKVNLKILTHILGPEYTVYTATNGASGINIATECKPDLILLDILMPDMDGYQTLAEIKRRDATRKIPVIFITGLASEKDEEKGLALEAADYITKPFSAMIVRLRVRNQIQLINLRRDLEDAVKNAKMANQTKSLFLAHMSHEIRTPMNSILGITEILMQQEALSGKTEEGLGKIYNSGNLLLGIINDILDFSKIEAGKLEIMPAQYKVTNMINDSLQLNIMRILNTSIEFELHIEEDIPENLIGDELRIKQILNNLLSNAFKYTDAGKVTLSIKAEPSPDLSDEYVTLVLSVRDTGYGMSEEQLARLFEEYTRFHNKTSRTIEGTGLGLSIVKRLISIMGGEITVESELDVGSYFVVRLPQGKIDAKVIGRETVESLRQVGINTAHRKIEQIVRDPMPYGSVLVVDDVESNIYVAAGLMKFYKIQIDTAMSGQEAIDKVKDGKTYDIMFVDHMMPKMDGMETTKHLRDMGYTAPIVALTASAVVGQAEIFLQNGFDEFISKPIDTRQLDSILNKLIRDKQPPEVIEAARRQRADEEALNTVNVCAKIDPLLFQSFIRDACKSINWLEAKIQDEAAFNAKEDLRTFIIIIHGMKSSLWSIGEHELSELAGKLESSGRELSTLTSQVSISTPQDFQALLTDTRNFSSRLRLLLEHFESEQEKNFHVHVSPEDTEELYSKLSEIQEMCSNYNRKGALDLISGITKYSAETKEVLDKIMKHVLHSEFEEAESEAAAYALIAMTDHTQSTSSSSTVSRLAGKTINGLDIARGLDRYEGDEEVYLKVLRSYVTSVRSMLDEIETVSEDTLAGYKIRVHGIKGTSLDFFAGETGKTALALEKAALSGDYDYVKEHNPAFLENTWKLIYDLEEMLAGLDMENPKPRKDKPDSEVLAKLLDACMAYDIDEADTAMAEIGRYQYESDDGLADWLKANLDRMDFKQIVERLGGVKS